MTAGIRTLAIGKHGATGGPGQPKEAEAGLRGAPPAPAGSRNAQAPPAGVVEAPASKSQERLPFRLANVLIRDVPHIRQKPDFCGEACAAMYLRKLGRPVDQDYVFDQSGLDPRKARGCYTGELAAALGNIGFQVGPVWHKIPVAGADEALEALWKKLHGDLVAGVPSIVCTRYDGRPNATEHFRLILGYDADSDEILYHEPAEDRGAYRRMKRATFLSLWPLKYEPSQWTVIVMRLEPGQLKQGTAASTLTRADYAQHMMQLAPKIPGAAFTVVVQPPFVVIGDESPAAVKERAERTIQWAVDKLKDAYFETAL